MTVQSTTSRADYAGDNVTVTFAIPFRFLANGDIQVIRSVVATGAETILTLDSLGADGYTVTGAGNPAGGSITVVTAPTSAQRLAIVRDIDATQLTDYIPNDPFPAETLEQALDKLTMLIQQALSGAISRVLRLFSGDVDGAGRYNANGNRIVDMADGVDPQDAATVGQLVGAGSGNFIQGGAGAVTRTMQDKVRDSAAISVMDFGANGDGATDDWLPFQRAADFAFANNIRRIIVPDLQYSLQQTVQYDGAIEWISGGFADLTSSTAGGGHATTRPSIQWNGNPNEPMFVQLPTTVGNIINGGGFQGIHLDGNTLASYGLQVNNSRYTRIRLHGRGFRNALLHITSVNGTPGNNSQKVIIEELRFVFGQSTQPDTHNACGVIIEGVDTTITQVIAHLIDGTVYDGSLVRITEHDNGQFYYVRGNVFPGRSGYVVEVLNASGVPSVQDGCQNVFYYVAGNMFFGANTINNRVLHFNTEAGIITGTGQYHINAVDVTTAEQFHTHSYTLLDSYTIPTSEFIAIAGGPTRVVSNGVSPAWSFPLGADARIAAIMPAPYAWGKGRMTGVRVYITASGAEVGANVVIGIRLSDPRDGTSIVAVPARTDFTVGINNTAGVVEVHDLILGTAEDYVKYSMLAVSITFVGTSGSHTVVNPPHLLGAHVLFEGAGPNRSPATLPIAVIPPPAAPGY